MGAAEGYGSFRCRPRPRPWLSFVVGLGACVARVSLGASTLVGRLRAYPCPNYARWFGGPGECDMMALAMVMSEQEGSAVYSLEQGSMFVRVYMAGAVETADLSAIEPRPNDVVMEHLGGGKYDSWVRGDGGTCVPSGGKRKRPA